MMTETPKKHKKPGSKKSKTVITPLRKIQSEVEHMSSNTRKGKSTSTTNSTTESSDSEGELPDPFSLLKTPPSKEMKRRSKRSQRKESKANKRRRRLLVKSASAIDADTSCSIISNYKNNTDDDDDDHDHSIEVPGELVLAYSLKKYYPAMVLSQVANNRFLVMFCDGSKGKVSRKSICTMYDPEFHTCTMGDIQLVGDSSTISGEKDKLTTESADLYEKFSDNDEDSNSKFGYLIEEMSEIKPHLTRLHSCSLRDIANFSEIEDRMCIFFGDNNMKKRLLSSRVSKGPLNRNEFYFVACLVCKWFKTPPAALFDSKEQDDNRKYTPGEELQHKDGCSVNENHESGNSHEADTNNVISDNNINNNDCTHITNSKELVSHKGGTGIPTVDIQLHKDRRGSTSSTVTTASLNNSDLEPDPKLDPDLNTTSKLAPKQVQSLIKISSFNSITMAVRFNHEVLLPHSIKRIIMKRTGCDLAEAEVKMQNCAGESGFEWVYQILAARGMPRKIEEQL